MSGAEAWIVAILLASCAWLTGTAARLAAAPDPGVTGVRGAAAPPSTTSTDPPATGPVRPAAVAGGFYPADPAKLRGALDAFLARAEPRGTGTPLALVVPHAGYAFSGQIAADAFAQVAGRTFDTIVLLGTNHTTPGFARAALYRGSGFRTPLGVAEIDHGLVEALQGADPEVVFNDDVHAREHSIEVQVPFVQRLWPNARILPLVVANPDLRFCERLGKALASAIGDRRVLVVASSDLSHYAAEAEATRADRALLDAIETLAPETVRAVARSSVERGVRNLVTAACGEAAIFTAMYAARALGATRAVTVSHATSADSPAGTRDRTVGYAAVVLGADVGRPPAPLPAQPSRDALTSEEGAALVAFAGDSIRQYLETGTLPLARTPNPRLRRELGAFVTLRESGQLRGCIGRILPDGPLLWTVGFVALSAAVQDPRFPPVTAAELPRVAIEVSVLGRPRRIAGPGDVRIGRDGVILEKAGATSAFLPEIPVEEGWHQLELVEQLCAKAGLPTGCWENGARLSVFQTQTFGAPRRR